jgi:hypothetical protein
MIAQVGMDIGGLQIVKDKGDTQGMMTTVGYAPVSSLGQDLAVQLETLKG